MLDLFNIGFYTVTLLDLIDIVIISFILYKVYKVVRGTIATQIFIGLVFVLISSFISQLLNLRTVSWLLKLITDTWVIAFIILFQPELRRILLQIGKNPFLMNFQKGNLEEIAEIITDAAFELSELQHGALIVLAKSTQLNAIAESGDILNAKLSKNLLKSVFYPRSPLHDGAIIIVDNIITAARCSLPLTNQKIHNGLPLGMRHRAALGISEVADVLCIIVSEETGSIGIAHSGILKKGLSKNSLKEEILRNINPKYKKINKA